MKTAPASLAELKAALAAIFPSLPRDVGTSGESVFAEAGPTFNSLLRDFVYFFAREVDGFSDRQLRRFAELVLACSEAPGPLADAMQACFTEPLRELAAHRRFDPFLSAARESARK